MKKLMHTSQTLCLAALLILVGGCSKTPGIGGAAGDAAPETVKVNAQFAKDLKLDEQQDFEDAKRGLVSKPEGKITDANGQTLIDFDAFKFIDGPAPATVNPSLWRHAQLDSQVGLFKVTDGVYQVRGFDMSNMTLVEGKSGWIVIDTLTARESAAAALAFVRKHLGEKPVSAIVFTHSHIDHFGGALGVVTAAEVAARKIPVVASEGFMEEATDRKAHV